MQHLPLSGPLPPLWLLAMPVPPFFFWAALESVAWVQYHPNCAGFLLGASKAAVVWENRGFAKKGQRLRFGISPLHTPSPLAALGSAFLNCRPGRCEHTDTTTPKCRCQM